MKTLPQSPAESIPLLNEHSLSINEPDLDKPAYTYTSLPTSPPSIRLVELLPGRPETPLTLHLRALPLTAAHLAFTALSYCWGDASVRKPVWVASTGSDPTAAAGMLAVTSNLHAFLLAFRHTTQSRVVWIDAICIDQSSIPERNSQVALMRHIYKAAADVRVWLGDADLVENSDEAVQFARFLAGLNPVIHNPWRPGGGRVTPWPTHRIWRDVVLLFRRDWFTRAWVVQEVLYARSIVAQCGAACISWQELIRALNYMNQTGMTGITNTGQQPQPCSLMLSAAGRLAIVDPMPPDPLYILLDCMVQQSTDPRDKVFAFYGLLPRFLEEANLRPDYNLTVGDVYTTLTKAWLEKFKNLDVFTAISGGEYHPDTKGLPSWIVNWSRATNVRPFLHAQRPFKASGDSSTHARFGSENRLCLYGYVVEQIVEVSKPFSSSSKYSGVLSLPWQIQENELEDLEREEVAQARSRRTYPTRESMLDAYWQTLCAGSRPDIWEATRKSFYHWDRWRGLYRAVSPFKVLLPLHVFLIMLMYCIKFCIKLGLNSQSRGLITQERKDWLLMRQRAVDVTGRRLFRTENGYIGLGPETVAAGDSIGLFEGGRLPLVMRSTSEEWQLLGDCYMHGAMQGEQWNPERRQKIWFN